MKIRKKPEVNIIIHKVLADYEIIISQERIFGSDLVQAQQAGRCTMYYMVVQTNELKPSIRFGTLHSHQQHGGDHSKPYRTIQPTGHNNRF
jgi:hypothetical protein